MDKEIEKKIEYLAKKQNYLKERIQELKKETEKLQIEDEAITLLLLKKIKEKDNSTKFKWS